jgi:hypothetical protein
VLHGCRRTPTGAAGCGSRRAARTGELINPVRATVLRLALAEGLRVLARRYDRE